MLSRNELQAIIHDLGSTQKEQAIARLQLDALPEEQEPPTFSPEAHDMLRAFGRNHLREVTKDGIAYAFRDGVHESAAGHNIVVTAAYKEQKGPFTVETSESVFRERNSKIAEAGLTICRGCYYCFSIHHGESPGE
jgi:hypothetical protein